MRTFKYKNKKFSEYIETVLTSEEQIILDSDIGNTIDTLNFDLMKQKMVIQTKIQKNNNTDVSENDLNILNSILNKIKTDLGDDIVIMNMVINYDDNYVCNLSYRINPAPKTKTYTISNEELF